MTAMLYYRLIVYILDLDDGSGSKDWRQASLSITKLAGAASVFVGLRAAWIAGKDLHAAIIGLIVAGISALFGRSMWKCWLLRNTWSSDLRRTDERREERVERTEHRITELRFTDGVPAVSLPARDGATTPAGET